MTSLKRVPARPESVEMRSRWRKGAGIALAGLFGLGLLSIVSLNNSAPLQAETNTRPYDSVQTPYGRAPLSFADLVEKIRPAVVSVNVKNGKKTVANRDLFKGLPDLPDDHPLNEFFKRFKKEGPENFRPSLAQGSGFIISADGYVVTNHHVAGEASEIQLTLDNGQKVDAKLVGSDQRTDIALLKIQDRGTYPYVRFANKPVRVGDWVLAVGNPFGLGGTVTAGIVSAQNRDIGSGPYDYIQIDAAVNRGNSGGPAFNLDGEVVGVNTAIFSPSGGNVGIAFAVPAGLAKEVVAELQQSGSVSRGWLGVTIQNVTDDIAASLGLDKAEGAMITKINDDGPASKSDLKIGDAIVGVNNQEIKDSRDLARTIAELNPNSSAQITIYRDGARKEVNVKLGRFPGLKKLAKLDQGKPLSEEMEDLGLTLAPAGGTPGAGNEGVVITDVDPSSKAADKGLKAGDVILEVGGEEVSAPSDVVDGVRNAKKKGRKAVLMRVKSGDQQRFIALPLKKS